MSKSRNKSTYGPRSGSERRVTRHWALNRTGASTAINSSSLLGQRPGRGRIDRTNATKRISPVRGHGHRAALIRRTDLRLDRRPPRPLHRPIPKTVGKVVGADRREAVLAPAPLRLVLRRRLVLGHSPPTQLPQKLLALARHQEAGGVVGGPSAKLHPRREPLVLAPHRKDPQSVIRGLHALPAIHRPIACRRIDDVRRLLQPPERVHLDD